MQTHPKPHTRRTIVKGLALGLVAAGWASGQAQSDTRAPATPSAAPAAAQMWRAVSRVGYGPTPQLLAELQAAASPQAWALQHIALARAASQTPPLIAPELSTFNAPLPDIFAGAQRERQARAARKASSPDPLDAVNYSRTNAQQAAQWRLQACAQPGQESPLLARMTEFWFNHFNVYVGKGAVRPFVGHYVVHVARAHALGRFEDLLLASARHPAMLLYLDQARSVAEGTEAADGARRGLNENYARELLELHTLGVAGGYTQADVRELARMLTGWTVAPQAANGFRFVPRLHDRGSKRLLGRNYPDSISGTGEREAEQAIRLLARHPKTAARISLRLAQFFVADEPPAALVTRLSQVFLESQGDIALVLRSLFEASEFWNPEHQLFKTPLDFACSALLAVQASQGGAESATPLALERRQVVLTNGFLAQAGQPMHGWQTPDGYKFDAATWLAPEALTRRADFAMAMGREARDIDFLLPFLSSNTHAVLSQQRPAQRFGLALASPDFMSK
jgi:uncharacterized protein (DUF1800 family)